MNAFQVRLFRRPGAGSIPASQRMSAIAVRPISMPNPRSASRIFVYPPPWVLLSELDDQPTDVPALSRPPGPSHLRAVVLRGRQSPEPRQDRLGPHDLAALRSLPRRQSLALQSQASPLRFREPDALRAGSRRQRLLQCPDLFLRVLQLPSHAVVDRRRDCLDQELDRQRKHRLLCTVAPVGGHFKLTKRPSPWDNSSDDFPDTTGSTGGSKSDLTLMWTSPKSSGLSFGRFSRRKRRSIRASAGHPYRDPRDVLYGVLWVLRTGAPWKDLPSRYRRTRRATADEYADTIVGQFGISFGGLTLLHRIHDKTRASTGGGRKGAVSGSEARPTSCRRSARP